MLERVLFSVRKERLRQDAKWGVQNHEPLKWAAIITEECGEVSKAVLEDEIGEYYMELIQIAAVAVAAAEALLRKEG